MNEVKNGCMVCPACESLFPIAAGNKATYAWKGRYSREKSPMKRETLYFCSYKCKKIMDRTQKKGG